MERPEVQEMLRKFYAERAARQTVQQAVTDDDTGTKRSLFDRASADGVVESDDTLADEE